MKLRSYLHNIFLVGIIACPFSLSAQETLLPCDEVELEALEDIPQGTVESITAFQPAQSVERIHPKYPKMAARAGAEGWVQMSYVIDTVGNVQDPIIEDSGGHRMFKRSALDAIKKWKFDPAVKDGKPTQQCHQAVQFDFTLGDNIGANRRFVRKYKEADALVKSQEYDAAEILI